MNPKRAAGVGLLGGLAGAALAAAGVGCRLAPAGAAAAAEDERHDRARRARRAGAGSAATAGACPTSRPGEADIWFAEGFCHAQDRLFQMDFYRRVVRGRLSEIAGPETLAGRPPDADAGHPPRRRARGGGPRPERARPPRALLRGGQRRRRRAPGRCPSRCSSCASASSSPGGPADILSLGKLLAFGLATNWERELLRSDMVRALGPELAAKLDPSYPVGNPIATQEPWSGDGIALVEQIDAVRRTMGFATEASGSNNWAVSGKLSATGSPLIAGDPHLLAEHAGHLVPGRPAGRRPLRPRRLPAGPARRLHGPEQRRLLDLHQRDARRPGPLRRAGRGRPLPVRRRSGGRSRSSARRSRSRAATARGRSRCAPPTTARSSTRRSAPTTPSRSPCAG